ncbi:MAG: baseplate protein [Cytophagales bacterium]|nr:baseplate protein [Cytophagales bacterium]
MKLPKIDSPIFQIKLISIDTPVKFRPFTVKEEKLLLIAEESKEPADILSAIKQVINNCCVSDIDIDKLPVFDIEYFFLQLRSKSVSNITTLKYKDKKDEIIREFDVNLDEIRPKVDSNHSNIIKITDKITVQFRYPSINMAIRINKMQSPTNVEYLAECLDKVYEEDEVYEASNFKFEERVDFINSLNSKMFDQIMNTFIKTMPKLSHTIEYQNKEGENRKIVLEGYRSFFQ